MEKKFHIKDVIDIEFLQKLQDQFAIATNFAVIIVDSFGKPITNHSNCSSFCHFIRKEKNGNVCCEYSDARGGENASRTGELYFYRCHSGLVDFAAPIIFQGQYLGSMMAGQVLIEENKLQSLEKVCPDSIDWKSNSKLLEAYNQLPTLPFERVKAVGETMSLFCNHIIERGFTNRIQKDLYEKERKLLEATQNQLALENALKEAELKILHSQINPHFLFNALTTISSLSIIEKAPKTQELVYNLSDMLRHSLKKTSQLVTLKEEFQYIERYLKFQKTRFKDRIDFSINLPSNLSSVRIPFMTLQPLVENALIHGLELKETGGIVSIFAYPSKNDVLIFIKDNGLGMSSDKLELIINKKTAEKATILNSVATNGLGINNVNQRLIHYYGHEYALKINSKLDIGTQVTVTIPNH